MAIFIRKKINVRMEAGTCKGPGALFKPDTPCAFFMGGGMMMRMQFNRRRSEEEDFYDFAMGTERRLP